MAAPFASDTRCSWYLHGVRADLSCDRNLATNAILFNELTANLPLKLNSSKIVTAAAIDLSGAEVTGAWGAARMPALTGDVTTAAGAVATTLATVGTPGTYAKVTTDSQGRVTADSG
jgi:hypothetical protein